jgi:epoxyqueuosine reductase
VTRPQTLTPPAELVALGRAAGLDAVGVCSAAPFPEVRATLDERKAEGLHGGMRFTYRDPARSTDPANALRRAGALVVGARSYHQAEPAPPPADEGPTARVASYAWADHYGELKAALEPIARRLRADGWRSRVLADDNALVDRAAAVRAGLGWWGKSSNVLLPGQLVRARGGGHRRAARHARPRTGAGRLRFLPALPRRVPDRRDRRAGGGRRAAVPVVAVAGARGVPA